MIHEITMVTSGIWFQLQLIAPYWISGLLAGSLISVYLSNRISGKMLVLSSDSPGIWQICLASSLGVISPLCMYGTVPVIAALGKKGLPEYLLAAFMVSSIMLNPNLLFLTFVLGTDLALARLIFCLVAGILAGFLAKIFFKDRKIFCLEQFSVASGNTKKTFLPDFFKAAKITLPYILIGVTITALFDRYIPPHWIHVLFGERLALGVLFATTLSIPMYACGGGVIPLINAWLHAGMGYGDALAFMLAGPATKVVNLSAVKIILGNRNFLIYLVYCLGFAMLVGFMAELFI